MRRLFAVFFGMVAGGLLVFLAFNFYFVRTDQGWLYVQKDQTALADFYVDVRGWDIREWASHPKLAQALSEQGHGDVVKRQIVPEGILNDLLMFRKRDEANREVPSIRRE